MAQSHHVLRRKKVEFFTFRQYLLGCPQNIIAELQNIVYFALCPANLAKSLVEDSPLHLPDNLKIKVHCF
jgi:hypothetical protein